MPDGASQSTLEHLLSHLKAGLGQRTKHLKGWPCEVISMAIL